MAWTLDDYDKLKEAIATGALRVEYADKRIEYRSLDDMLRTLALMEKDLGLIDTKKNNGGRVVGIFNKGL